MLKKILFRLDSGGHFGLGHLIRAKALADAFLTIDTAKNKIKSTFAVKTIYVSDAVKPHQLIKVNSEQEFISLATSYDIIIIDHYDYTSDLFLQLSRIKRSILVVIDDECNRGNLYADIVINSAGNALTLPYKNVAARARLLLGNKYALLRHFFSQIEYKPFEQRNTIIITFGGTDIKELTLPVLHSITNSVLADFHIIVVAGSGCNNLDEIEKYCLEQHFTYKYNVENMAALFATAKFAISAAGSTIYELACCGVPAVFAVVADNQLISATEQSQLGWCSMVDCRDYRRVDALVNNAVKMINNTSLKGLSNKALSLIDGKGSERVASIVIELLKQNR